MPDEPQINPGHNQVRDSLRIIGLIMLVAAVFMAVIAFADFIGAMNRSGRPALFWLFFIAMPLGFIGLNLTAAGFAGAVARYQAQEMAPVGKDTFNYMADGTQEGVATIAGAVAEGIRSAGDTVSDFRCPTCDTPNDPDARFCKSCGEPLTKTSICPSCSNTNDADARFCDACGHALRS